MHSIYDIQIRIHFSFLPRENKMIIIFLVITFLIRFIHCRNEHVKGINDSIQLKISFLFIRNRF